MNEEKELLSERKGEKMLPWVAQLLNLENPGIDLGTSRMQSGRSTIWANSPDTSKKSENKTIKILFYTKRQTSDLH